MAAVEISIGTAARDYETFALAKADDWGGDGLGNDDITVRPYNDSDFNEVFTITESFLSLLIEPVESERHDGTADSGMRLAPTSGLTVITVNVPNVVLSWMEIDGGGARRFDSGGVRLNAVSGSDATGRSVHHMLVHDGAGFSGCGINSEDWNISPETAELDAIFDNIVYEIEQLFDSSGIGVGTVGIGGSQICRAYNNTVHRVFQSGTGTSLGMQVRSHAAAEFRNNISTESDDGDFSLGALATVSNNHSSDLTASGTGSTTGIDPADVYVSVEPGMEDFHHKPTSPLLGLGADLGTTPAGVEIDIDGEDRTGLTWDPGADQFFAAEEEAASTARVGLSVSILRGRTWRRWIRH